MNGLKHLRPALILPLALLMIILQASISLASGYTTRMSAINEAMRHIGEPYVWGSGWPKGFDCSGYINYIMQNAGLTGFYSGPYTHGPTADVQAESFSTAIDTNSLVPGDLLFLDGTYDAVYPSGIGPEDTWTHVGVYAGNGLILQSGSGGVGYRQLSAWTSLGTNPYATNFGGARRIKASLYPGGDSSYNPKEGIKYLAGDFNGDGKNDVVAFQDYTRAATGIWSYATKPTGTISAISPAKITLTPTLSWLTPNDNFIWKNAKPVTGDFDGDHKTEIAAFYNYGGTSTAIFLFKPNGSTFTVSKAWESHVWDWTRTKPVAGDIDGDGKDEITTFYNYGSASLGAMVFKLNSTGQFYNGGLVLNAPGWDWSRITLTAGKSSVATRDTIIAAYDYGNGTVKIWRFNRTSTGNLSGAVTATLTGWSMANASLSMLDCDADGKDDIVSYYNYGGSHTTAFYLRSIGWTFLSPVKLYDSSQWTQNRGTYLPGDFNGDGKKELMAMYDYASGPLGAFLFVPKVTSLAAYGPVWFSP